MIVISEKVIVWCFCFLVLSACGAPRSDVRRESAQATPHSTPTAPAPAAPTAPVLTLFAVATSRGISEVDSAGNVLRALSPRAARWLAPLAAGRFVAINETLELRVVPGDAPAAQLRTSATCRESDGHGRVTRQVAPLTPNAITTSRDGRYVCVDLSDAAFDGELMGSIRAVVDLNDGSIFEDVRDGCNRLHAAVPTGVECEPAGEALLSENGIRASRTFFTEEYLRRSVSPSRRYELWQIEESEGQFRDLLVEAATNTVWAVPHAGGSWPNPVAPEALLQAIERDEATGEDAVGGWVDYAETVEWLNEDALRVGRFVLRPRQNVVDLGGTAVQRAMSATATP